MKRPHSWIWFLAASVALAAPLSALAADIPVPAKVHLVKQDKNAGFAGKLAKIVNKPVAPATFPLPGSAPTSVGGTLRFFQIGVPGVWDNINLPAGQWIPLGPGGSKGYKYRGTGSPTDPCRVVLVKEKVIKAVCKGAGSTDSPSPYAIPVASAGNAAAWELVIGSDRYCASAESFMAGGSVKKNDGSKGLYKAIKANAPGACPNATPPATPTPPPPTPTPPYGSASKAFLDRSAGLLE